MIVLKTQDCFHFPDQIVFRLRPVVLYVCTGIRLDVKAHDAPVTLNCAQWHMVLVNGRYPLRGSRLME